MTVRVRLDVTDPGSHMVDVEMRFPAAGTTRTFRMPAWVPGSYKIRDFGRNVQEVTAEVAGKTHKIEPSGKDRWVVKSGGKPVTLRYRVYSRELDDDRSHVTADHAHLFAPTLVVYDDHSRCDKHQIQVVAPRGWRVWSGLENSKLDGALDVADDYDHLIDCPIEVGPPADYADLAFTVRGKKHRLVFWQPPKGMDEARITKDVKAIVTETAKLWGGLPYEHYTFLSHVAADHGGGLEHRNSTVLGVDPVHLLSDEMIKTKFIPLVTHEFFHTWNVKRILPAAMQPYDLQQEVYTDLLWLFEGFTTYYELPIPRRAGVYDDEAFGKVAAEILGYYETAIGRRVRSVSECSRLTWSLLYQPHEHNINRGVSYYTKGLAVGLCLDAHLRKNGVKDGLDVVMRYLWKHHRDAGVPEDAFPGIVKAATGIDCGRVLAAWLHGTSELPIDAALRTLGFEIKREHKDPKKPIGLGVMFKGGGSTIERIPDDSPCWRILQPDDELVAVEGYKWKGDRFAEWANTKKAGDTISVSAFREGRLRTFDVPLREMRKDKITVTVRKGDAVATRRRKAWLHVA